MQKMKTRLREQAGPEKKNYKIFTFLYYHGKHGLQILRKISAQKSNSIVSGLAQRVARGLEQGANGGDNAN